MRLIVMQFLSLDGVSQAPGAPDEDTSDGFTGGGWFVPYLDEHFERIAADWTGRADAFLFGRRTYENFARDWPEVTDPADPVATALNTLPKYVATSTGTEPSWNPTTVLTADVPARVAELKQQPGRELQVHGSSRLARTLFAAGLVDEVRLAIAPVVVGSGRRLFPDGAAPVALRPTQVDRTPGGLAIHVYETAGVPEFGEYRRSR
jgi:dihydrofolate reductase